MLNFNQTIESLETTFGINPGQTWLKDLAMCSSLIVFRGVHEDVFCKGDRALGFYLVLDGDIENTEEPEKPYSKGSLVGLSNFLKQQNHKRDIATISETVRALFINEKGYSILMKCRSCSQALSDQLLPEKA